jgi:LPS export ABC transporter permease LptG/LPS export ABC transporter permease LptF
VRIFTRYILREVTGYALLGGVLFTFILFMRYLLPLLELAVRGIASPLDLLRLIGYLLPYFLTITIPMAVLIGILLGLSRLASDSEITAMRASGLGVVSFLRIVSIVAVLSWIVGLAISLYVAPRAARALLDYEEQSKTSQATVEVQPRVFYEDFKNYVLYTQDVLPGANGTAIWKHVFLADLTQPATPHIISAQEAIVQAGNGHQTLRLDLINGSRHDISATDPAQYDIATFNSTVLPIETSSQEDTHLSRRDTPMQALDTSEVWRRAHASSNTSETRPYSIEFHRRLSFPTACLVLMLVGVPLGLSSKRGGKGSGFAVTLLLVFLYYFMSEIGVALARQQKLPAFAGVWGANLLFAGAGILLIQQISRGGVALSALSGIGNSISKLFDRILRIRPSEPGGVGAGDRIRRLRRAVRSRFPLILDEYAMGSFLRNFFLVLCSLTVLFIIFTFFELIGDIIRYRTPLVTVGDYLINLIPFILYNVTPLCSLVAVLITFGALSRSSEITAMKASGVCLYRIVTPVLLVAAVLSALLFAFDESYLPAANRRQEALLSSIKGKPAQTFLRPDRKWISGQNGNSSTEPTRIFYYQAFDPYRNVFANITVFEFQPGTFTLSRRIYAESAHWDAAADHWDFENGWERVFASDGASVQSYQTFKESNFGEIRETPVYFKKEERPSQEMSYSELSSYIRDLEQSGFDTTPLRVQLNRKLAYPLLTLVMAILAVPFSLSVGKRGSLAGIGAAVALAILWYVLAGISENLGNVNSLPAVLAAWSPDLLFAMAGSYLLLRTPT